MKVFISVDMEGCSGIVSRQETMPTGDFYREARHWMAWDANAAVDGCLDGGAKLALLPGVQRTAELTVCYNSEDFDNVWRTLWAMVFIASTTRDPIPW